MDGFTTYMKISNNIEIKEKNGDFEFDYFNKCDKNDTTLGSHYSLKDVCRSKKINEDKLCNSLFNNNTKRKIVVDTDDIIDSNNLIINNENNNYYLDKSTDVINNIINTINNNTVNNTLNNNTMNNNTINNNNTMNNNTNNISLNISENI